MVENTTEMCRKARQVIWTREDETMNTSEGKHWRWYHLGGEEEEEDQSRDGWTVSTET